MKLWGFIAPHLLRDDHYPKLRGSLRPKVLTHSQLWLFDFSMSVRSKICQRRSADFWGFMSGRFLNDVRRYIQHWSKYNHTGIDMEKSNRKQWNLFFWTSFHIHPYSIPEWLPKWPKFSELPQKHLWHRVTLAYGLFKFLHLEFHSGNSHSLNKKAGTHYPQTVGLLAAIPSTWPSIIPIYGWWILHGIPIPIGSMVLVYMLTWLGYIDGIHVTIYSIRGSYGIWFLWRLNTCFFSPRWWLCVAFLVSQKRGSKNHGWSQATDPTDLDLLAAGLGEAAGGATIFYG